MRSKMASVSYMNPDKNVLIDAQDDYLEGGYTLML